MRIEMYSIGMFSLDELVKMLDIIIRKAYVEMNLKASVDQEMDEKNEEGSR